MQILKSGYQVEKIVGRRLNTTKRKGKYQYLVKWEGYDSSQNTWEPEKNLEFVQDLILEYQQANQCDKDQNFFDEKSSSSVYVIGQPASDWREKKLKKKIKKTVKRHHSMVEDEKKLDHEVVASKHAQYNITTTMNTTSIPQIAIESALNPVQEQFQRPEAPKGENQQSPTQPDSIFSSISNMCNNVSTSTASHPAQSNSKQINKHITILGMRKDSHGKFSYFIVDQVGQRWVDREIMVNNYPIILCEFYEQRIVFSTP